MNTKENLLNQDKNIIWHPYSAFNSDIPVYPVQSASGVKIKLMDGRELIDGMSSWWSAIHGYNHPDINAALTEQLQAMAHVMFGGLTHQPAVNLALELIKITPCSLQTLFFADSGSVAVEVAIKMAIQYWQAMKCPEKNRLLTIRYGYHGDTFGAMAVCDPDNGMHHLFKPLLSKHFFADAPECGFDQPCTEKDIESLATTLAEHHQEIAAIILEPIVQGAGGMRFYSPDYLRQVRDLCNQFDVLLIVDEIATGFGRTGKLFACEHSGIEPDIMCLGKALTAGYMTLAATLTTKTIATTISSGDPGIFMHGPTFMANPLACSAGLASLRLLLDSPWQTTVDRIEKQLATGLSQCREFRHVKAVRVLGAIGVVELYNPVNMKVIQEEFVDSGVWIRPFNKLIYLMPPFIISDDELEQLITAIIQIVSKI